MTSLPADQSFLEFVVRAIVEHPEDIEVFRKVDTLGILLELKVAPQDMGKIIGKGGQTIKSLRTLLRVAGSQKEGNRVNLRLLENNEE